MQGWVELVNESELENKLPLSKNRGQTKRFTILASRNANLNPWQVDLELWPWLSFPGELWLCLAHVRNAEVRKLEWKPNQLTDTTDRITFPTNAVGEEKRMFRRLSSSSRVYPLIDAVQRRQRRTIAIIG